MWENECNAVQLSLNKDQSDMTNKSCDPGDFYQHDDPNKNRDGSYEGMLRDSWHFGILVRAG